ncbi:MAG TPA: tRNA uridine-5-carboxymethylaminomethyl(34) synthesis GTPase MnmE [Bacteroidales bacterium]|jgi:tRNA modification GTPase|nr:tRNA uridine-5-carboxymethylaminomethyl(34) synthesis GTPase MnmE [Bacteroidales bacterium]
MVLESETICAIATAPGKGAIATIRLSGSDSKQIIQNIFKPSKKTEQWYNIGYSLHYGSIYYNNELLDDVLVSIFNAPHSYTGEDSVEISCHGSVYIQNEILKLLLHHGARLAKPGEFTQRAFLNGKLDLSQAEAVADLIASTSAASHKLALSQIKGGYAKELQELRLALLQFLSMIELELDFSEEEVEFADREQLRILANNLEHRVAKLLESFSIGNAIKTGVPVCIVGEPNVGKSTLLNTILNEEKAIVSDIPGTTRDVIEDTMVIGGKTFRFMDTAGIRDTSNIIEQLGIDRTFAKIDAASIVLFLIDVTSPLNYIKKNIASIKRKIAADKKLYIVVNKIDLITEEQLQTRFNKHNFEELSENDDFICISAKHKRNIDSLIQALLQEVHYGEISQDDAILTNMRHYEALQQAHIAITHVLQGIDTGLSNDLLSLELRQVLHYVGLITGSIGTEEMLGYIFEHFCIGK